MTEHADMQFRNLKFMVFLKILSLFGEIRDFYNTMKVQKLLLNRL